MAIDMEVLSINPFWYGKDRDTAAEIVKVQNEKLAELCASKPDRFAAFASLALQFPDLAVQQLETAVKKQGLRGAAIGGSVVGEDFSDPKFHPVWAKAEELGAVLFIHPQSTPELAARFKGNGWLSNTIGNPLDTTIALQHLIFEGTLDKFPGPQDHRRAWRRLPAVLRAALRPRLLRVAAELQSRHQAEEEADRISEPALFRRPGVHAGGAAASGGAGRRQPGRARHRPSDPVGRASGRPRLRHHDAERFATYRIIRSVSSRRCGRRKGSIKSGFIALHGEAGFEPEILRGGIHVFFPFTYRIHKSDLVTVGQGKIAYVFARDGAPLGASQVLAANDAEEKSDFQDARKFLLGGGQKGPQRKVLREGTYAINTTQFAIVTDERVYGHALSEQEQGVLNGMKQTIADREGFSPVILAANQDLVGVVTVHDGPSLPPGEIIAPEVGTDLHATETFHNNFQEPEKFLKAGGFRGRQLQVVVEGTWYINRLFATVEIGSQDRDPGRQCRRGDLLHRTEDRRRLRRAIPPRRTGPERQPRRLERSAAARQIRVQHLCRQDRDHPHRQLHPQMGARRSRRAEARREPVGDLADHQGRVRADAAALGGRAYRLQEGADDHSALRRREEAGRADARPDGQRLLQEHRAEDDADRAVAEQGCDPGGDRRTR